MAIRTFAVMVQVSCDTNEQVTADVVHEALCSYLHEECIAFVDQNVNYEFTNVGDVLEVVTTE